MNRLVTSIVFSCLIILGSTLADAQTLPEGFNAGFKIAQDYSDKLNEAAFVSTGDKQFQKPKEKAGSAVAWCPRSSTALKALGLTFRNDNMVQYVAGKSMFFAKGDYEWLRSLVTIHRDNKIFFKMTEYKPN